MITVLETGVLNSVQDAGRFGYRHLGVSTSGVMDPLALRCGNSLLGNAPEAACIEVQTFPFKVRFDKAVSFVVTGGEGTITLGERVIQPWSVATAQAGDALTLDRPSVGARMYVCVCGGIDVPVVLGSRSTQLRGGFGGYLGRPLQVDDQLAGVGGCVPDGFGAVPPLRALARSQGRRKRKNRDFAGSSRNRLFSVHRRSAHSFLVRLLADYSAKQPAGLPSERGGFEADAPC
ncbi:Allophanate hydrolase 2 subunit 2 [Acetobacter malorum]|uniref:Allophanate hydrolase 2 subunit 2 n=1 Tax=Acetobacter malorum TaxID=178901 RepID=A0A177GB01_9PROT|nr:Allophanate hydrolase 2 subunit 2 [Acetobacter malorum]